MRKNDRIQLERLLAGSPSPSPRELAQVREQVLDRVAQAREQARPTRSRWLTWMPAGLVAATGVFAAVIIGDVLPERGGEFTVRGSADMAGAFLLLCLQPDGSEPDSDCQQGETIVFDVRPPPGAGFFSAAALGPKDTLFLLFPSATESSLPVSEATISHRGIVLDSTYASGTYRVFGLFTEAPISASQMERRIGAHLSGESMPDGARLFETRLEVVAK